MKRLLLTVWLVMGLGACANKGKTTEGAEGADAEASAYGQEGANGRKGRGARTSQYGRDGAGGGAYGRGGRGGEGGSGSGGPDAVSGPLSKRVIYFMYDSDEVMPEYRAVISAHAEYLATHPDDKAVLAGHADERGSSEYNVALGEQRAKSVLRMMQMQGAGQDQVMVVSFGEEKPSESGHDESSWQRNRRVEINYSGR